LLTVKHIPLYENEPENWDRFLDKSAQGSAKATEILSSADMAYMVALTGNPQAPATLPLTDYKTTLQQYFLTLEQPASAADLAQAIDTANWFTIKLPGHLATAKNHDSYSALWAKKRTAAQQDLLNDAVHHCHASWSAEWLLQVIDEESSLNYNSVNVVAAMLLLAITWKET
jgi:hypothetical protein